MSRFIQTLAYAYYYRRFPIQLAEEFMAVEKTAKTEKRGLWKTCPVRRR